MIAQSRSWAEIDLQALAHNYQYLRSLAPQSQFLGLCKADAYGHTARIIAPALKSLGAEILAVATAVEGQQLRQEGITGEILILGDSPPESYPLLTAYQLTPTVHNLPMALSLAKYHEHSSLPYHLKIDTGMGRLGFLPEDISSLQQVLDLPSLTLRGIFTHFACSDEEEQLAYTHAQEQLFAQVLSQLSLPTECLVHLCNSGGTLHHSHSHHSLIRPGIALYGYGDSFLEPVLSLYSKVASLRQIKKGESISYGATEVLTRDSLVAVLPIGYGDGYPRHMSNGGLVSILGQSCPILGRVCMDMCMVDVTELSGEITLGTVATLYGKDCSLLQAATRCDTISYELLCRLSSRIPRIPINENTSVTGV